jgi:hypothetical protein
MPSGEIGNMELFEKMYGKDETKIKLENGEIVPVQDEFVDMMKRWGFKKRQRYAQLLSWGHTQRDAFHYVEFHQGKIEK